MMLLLILPTLLIAMALVIRLAAGPDIDPQITAHVLQHFALGAIVPLLALLAGTGAIGSEIDDGSIIYLLAKPVRRSQIVLTKLLMAIGCVAVLGALPIFLTGWILTGSAQNLPVAFGIAAFIAGTAYCVGFLLLAVVSRHAVVIGLAYALAWESLVGGYLPGAGALSIQQWALAIADSMTTSTDVDSMIRLSVAIPLLAIAILGGSWLAGWRLRSFTFSHAD
ncbi:MAG: ABC transporter permease subunit [Jatrophihabitantaceae bacterium]